MEKSVCEASLQWRCHCCGECCRRLYPEVTPEEISLLLSYLPPETGFRLARALVDISPYQEEKTAAENKFIQPPCPLLREKKICSVHRIKPGSCQMWECGRVSVSEPFCV